MSDVPKKKRRSNLGDDQRERRYYYDDAHGYEEYDPEKDDEDELSGGTIDVDLDRSPPLLIEPEDAEEKPREMPD